MTSTATPQLALESLRQAVEGPAAAVRVLTRLSPAGGPGDKVFPPTYEGGRYASEQRRVDGRVVESVLLDSVQSQANRMEQALKARADAVGLPYLAVTIPRSAGDTTVTSLDAPHRVWDAIFRDSLWDGKPFRSSPEGLRLVGASPDDATAFFEYCPTALVFGMWDSTSGEGALGRVRWARALVSEVVGLDAVRGRRTSSRIDPLGITADAARIYRSDTDGWTLDEKAAVRVKDKPQLVGKEGKPSAVNHGNVTPTISGEDESGGVTVSEAVQTVVLSLPQLRRLRFPSPDAKGGSAKGEERDAAGRTVLAALSLLAVAAAQEDGYFLRSRAHLVPVAAPAWEVIGGTAQDVRPFALTADAAERVLVAAVEQAREAGLTWKPGPVVLTPSPKLVELVRRSDDKLRSEGDADAGA